MLKIGGGGDGAESYTEKFVTALPIIGKKPGNKPGVPQQVNTQSTVSTVVQPQYRMPLAIKRNKLFIRT